MYIFVIAFLTLHKYIGVLLRCQEIGETMSISPWKPGGCILVFLGPIALIIGLLMLIGAVVEYYN